MTGAEEPGCAMVVGEWAVGGEQIDRSEIIIIIKRRSGANGSGGRVQAEISCLK